MKKSRKFTIGWGILCVLLMAVSSWYAVTFNDSRLIAPMNFSEYVFRVQDLPMIIAGTLFTVYIGYLVVLLFRTGIAVRRREVSSQLTRTVNPKLGLLGFCGFAGFLGFWTYRVDKTIFPFVFFLFFGFFGFFYEGKMSNTLMDERYRENRARAQAKANKIAFGMIFIATLILGQGKLMGSLEYTFIAFVIVIAFSIALEIFLSEYLLYRYDSMEQFEESEE